MKPAAVAAVAGASVVGAVGLVAALLSSGGRGSTKRTIGGSSADEEAIARMLASENPDGSAELWTEQIWSQLRSLGKSSIWWHLTGGKGYGPQGGARPVATHQAPTAATRAFAARFLATLPPSSLPGARQFFEPVQQDRAFAIAEEGRRKAAKGLPLTPQEQRLRLYFSDATDIRKRWSRKGYRYVGTVDGVEFWT